MTLDNLASGLIGAIVGAVIGAVLGAALSIYWLRKDRESRREAAKRAVWLEIAFNGTIVGSIVSGHALGYWPASTAWEACFADIASVLSFDDLRKVAAPYHSLAAIEPARVLADENREQLRHLSEMFTNAQATLTPYINGGRF